MYGLERSATIGKRFINLREESQLRNAQVVVSILQQHLAKNHREGSIRKDGYVRGLKIGLLAPFEEFEHPERFEGVFAKGISKVQVGMDQRLVVPIFRHGSAVVLTGKNVESVPVILTTSTLSDKQITELQKTKIPLCTRATIIHGTEALPTDKLQEQLKAITRKAKIHDIPVPFSIFALAFDVDNGNVVADARDGSPEWFAAKL
jgi:hypothetical protein